MIRDEAKSADLLSESRQLFRDLDIPDAFQKVLMSLESDCINMKAVYQMKTLISIIAFSYPEKFETNRIEAIIENALKQKPKSPTIWNLRGLFYKLNRNWEKSEESYFRSVFYCDGTEPINSYYLFELAYVYKNTGNVDLFNRTAFSAPWQFYLVRKTGRFAIPAEISAKRITPINLKTPPIRYIKQFEQEPGKLHLLQIDKNPDLNELARLIDVLEKRSIDFAFFNNIPYEHHQTLWQILGKDAGCFYKHPRLCPAAIGYENFTITVCKPMADEIKLILDRTGEHWKVVVRNHNFCPCTNKGSNF
ncbi:MAG: hypothetical protein LWY06_04180 [Firmicutes bacterium]|nr:hypothetical protein [Bacillota bacterium]